MIEEEEYKGEIKGFPKEVVEKMLDRQEEQTGKRDVSVFENKAAHRAYSGGVDWEHTSEGWGFWNKVILEDNFEKFFRMYPKKRSQKDLEILESLLFEWVYFDNDNSDQEKCLFKITKLQKERARYYAYGFDFKGEWVDEMGYGDFEDATALKMKRATREQVAQALEEEALKRLPKEGSYMVVRRHEKYELLKRHKVSNFLKKARNATGKSLLIKRGSTFFYEERIDALFNTGSGLGVCYQRGVWSESDIMSESLEVREQIIKSEAAKLRIKRTKEETNRKPVIVHEEAEAEENGKPRKFIRTKIIVPQGFKHFGLDDVYDWEHDDNNALKLDDIKELTLRFDKVYDKQNVQFVLEWKKIDSMMQTAINKIKEKGVYLNGIKALEPTDISLVFLVESKGFRRPSKSFLNSKKRENTIIAKRLLDYLNENV